LLQRPEWLLDPNSKEAQDAAREARCFMKDFFDQVRSQHSEGAPKAALGLGPLVVDGFDRDQIWEELEVQNVPLRRYLKRLLPKFAKAPKGVVDVSISVPEMAAPGVAPGEAEPEHRSEPSARRKPAREAGARRRPGGAAVEAAEVDDAGADVGGHEEAEQAPGSDKEPEDFFDVQEMERFTTLGDQGKLRLDSEAGDSDFDMLEGDDDSEDDAETAKNAVFADFYLPGGSKANRVKEKKQRRKVDARADSKKGDEAEEGTAEEEGEEEMGVVDDDDSDAEKLSEEEKELEAQIQKLQKDTAPAGDEDGESEDEDDAGMEDGESEGAGDDKEDQEGAGAAADGGEGKSLYAMDRRLRSLEEEVAKLEEEQLEAKPWTLQGEVSAKERPLNSLLEVHLDQPMTHFAGRRAEDAAVAAGAAPDGEDALEDVAGADGLVKQAGFDIEAIIRQRIWDEMFDDVVRKTALPPSKRAPAAEDEGVETLNFEKSRVGLGDVYAKQYETQMLGHTSEAKVKEDKDKTEMKALFAKLMHKLDLLTNAHFTPQPPMLGADGQQLEKVASLKMEETIPLLVSDASLKAPEELRAPRRHERGREELSHSERVAARRAGKANRRKKLDRRVETGEMTLKGRREREEKLSAKNQEAKRENASKGEIKEQKKRLKASELLNQAALNASNHVSRKDEMRKERQKKPVGAPSSKRLKL